MADTKKIPEITNKVKETIKTRGNRTSIHLSANEAKTNTSDPIIICLIALSLDSLLTINKMLYFS